MLQKKNIAPTIILQNLRNSGVAEEHLPTLKQLHNFKTNEKNDQGVDSKHRLRTLMDLKEHFGAPEYVMTSEEQYENLSKLPYIMSTH